MIQVVVERLLNVALPLFVAPFLIFTALAFLKKGKAALNWSSGLTESVRVNTALMLVNSALAPVIVLTLGPLQHFVDSGGVWRLDPALWQALPAWLGGLLAVMLADFSDYWVHRLMHTKWLWPSHVIHHSDTVMNNTTSVRMHIIELVIMASSFLMVATVMSLPPVLAGLAGLFIPFYNRFVHLDADYHWGPLNRILNSPRLHRWHHADVPEAYGKNFANMFSLWDTLFGTYYLPGVCHHDLGVKDGPEQNLLLNYAWPLKTLAEAVPPLRQRLLRHS